MRFQTVLLILAILSSWGCASPDASRSATTSRTQPGSASTTGGATVDSAPAATAQAPAPVPVAPASAGAASAYPTSAPAIYAASAIAIDAATGRTLYSKNADVERPVASTQKLLTALLVVQRGGLDGPVTVSSSDTGVEPSKLGISAGQSYTRRQLLTAMMVKSCNDAAACLARNHSGSVPAFASEMNRYSGMLGNTHSHFANPHGLTAPGQYSTARDIARIAYAAYRNPALREMMALRGYTFRYADGRVRRLESTNQLLGISPFVNGMKTGYTVPSGRCLVTSARRAGRDVIIVQLGSNTKNIFADAARLVEWTFSGTALASADPAAAGTTYY